MKFPKLNKVRRKSGSENGERPKRQFKLPAVKLPKIKLPKLKLPKGVSPRVVLYSLFALVIAVAAVIAFLSNPPKRAAEEPVSPDVPADEEIEETEFVNDYVYEYYKFDPSILTEYKGDVKVISFHPVIAYPKLAFDGDSYSRQLDSWSLTAGEFEKILQSLYDKGYIIVKMTDVWSEYTAEDGSVHMQRSALRLPEGRKPVVLVFQDENFYEHLIQNGYTQKLILGTRGEVWSSAETPTGGTSISQAQDAITILDDFVKKNPDFSLGGAKGCIALTGYDGILGYRTQMGNEDSTARKKEIAAVKPVISQLKKTGWYFACHTYGHIDLYDTSYTDVVSDMTKWVSEVGSLVGETRILIAPQSEFAPGYNIPDNGETFDYLEDLGFRYYVSGGDEFSESVKANDSAVFITQVTVDGTALRYPTGGLSSLFDAGTVFDSDARSNYSGSRTERTP